MEEKIRCIRKEEEDYPERMRQLDHMPEQIYVRGRLPENKRPCAAIVGARLCSPYGAAQARRFARGSLRGRRADYQRYGQGNRRVGAPRSPGERRRQLGGSGMRGRDPGYPRENRDLYRNMGWERRTDLGVSSWTASPGDGSFRPETELSVRCRMWCWW